jgi:hypothetical protein
VCRQRLSGDGAGRGQLSRHEKPAGLIINAGAQTYGEASGSDEVTRRAKGTATEVAKLPKQRFQQQGWIN